MHISLIKILRCIYFNYNYELYVLYIVYFNYNYEIYVLYIVQILRLWSLEKSTVGKEQREQSRFKSHGRNAGQQQSAGSGF